MDPWAKWHDAGGWDPRLVVTHNWQTPTVPTLNCYRIRASTPTGQVLTEFEDVLEEDVSVESYGPVEGKHFSACLFVARSGPRRPDWSDFIESGFSDVAIQPAPTAPAALLVARIQPSGRGRPRPILFAFAFGPGGRYLLRRDVYERGYGLRTALNILYPRSASGSGRIRAVDSKRRAATILRSRIQVSHPSDFEVFDVNRMRDTVSRADGIPADGATWGRRVGGGDSLSLGLDLDFRDLGKLCRQIESTHARDDYRVSFDWIDYIQPVSDPRLVEQLEEEVIVQLRSRQLASLTLAPPQIVDWEIADRFRFHFDRPQGTASAVTHSELRLSDYLAGLSSAGKLSDVDPAHLRRNSIYLLDADGSTLYRWSVWRCLVAELAFQGANYILDEGDFFEVRQDYVAALDDFIAEIPESGASLPTTTPLMSEGDYNSLVASNSNELLLLDRQLIRLADRTTPIEICDLLSERGQLIHIKRHLGSSDLSHLFSQGLVSAELLQMSPAFRGAAIEKVREVSGASNRFDLFHEATLTPTDFQVVFAVAERWRNRRPAEALPFFSKVNLREVTTNLRSRGFGVAFDRIDAVQPSAPA